MATKYPLDETGSAVTNLVIDEPQSVQPPADIKNASFVVPLAAPFFSEKMEIWTGKNKTGKRLIEGKDFYFTHYFVAGSNWFARTLHGGVAWLDQTFKGTVYLTYQTLGGEFVVADVKEIENITNLLYPELRVVTWDQIKGVPSTLPPTAHKHPVEVIATYTDLVEAVRALSTGGGGSGGSGGEALALIQNHLAATYNAHKPGAVGLGLVANYAVATDREAESSSPKHYATPAIVSFMLKRAIAGEDLIDVRNRVTTLEDQMRTVAASIVTITSNIEGINIRLGQMDALISNIQQQINTLSVGLNRTEQSAMDSMAMANLAMASASANAANIDQMAIRMNTMLYAGTSVYPVGTHDLVIPPKSKLFISLVGAGGGSGAMYDDTPFKEKYTQRATDGQDSVVFLCGTVRKPIEPMPVLIAGGGFRGDDNYADGGQTKGGKGGQHLSAGITVLTSVPLYKYTDLKPDAAYDGTTGKTGDSSNTSTGVATGTTGHTINATGDLSKQMYGKGRDGVHKAGLGGSGARGHITVNNDTNEDYRITIVVGAPGNNSVNENTVRDNKYPSNGVAYTTYVS